MSPFNPYMGRDSRSPFYDMLTMPLLSGDANQAGLGPSAGQTTDDLYGGNNMLGADQTQYGSGTDLFNDQGFKDAFGPGKGPNASPPVGGVPGLPAFNDGLVGGTAPAVDPRGSDDRMINDRIDQGSNLDSKSMGDVGPPDIGSWDSRMDSKEMGYQGVQGANPPAGHDMLATGDTMGGAPGGRINFGGWDKGKNGDPGTGGGVGAGGVGNSGNSTGADQSGSQGSENGQGGYAKGGRVLKASPFMVDPNPMNADDVPIEAQKDEHVVTVDASKGLGRKFLDTANREFGKKGAKRDAVLKKLAPLLGKD